VINDKSHGCVDTHLKFDKIFNTHILTSLLLSLPMKKKLFESENIWQNCRKKVDCMLMTVSKGSFQ